MIDWFTARPPLLPVIPRARLRPANWPCDAVQHNFRRALVLPSRDNSNNLPCSAAQHSRCLQRKGARKTQSTSKYVEYVACEYVV